MPVKTFLRPTKRDARRDYPGLDPGFYWVETDDGTWHGPFDTLAEATSRFPELRDRDPGLL